MVEFVESEAERLPFSDWSFDVVISNRVIDLIPDKDAVFAELFRVLAPGGQMQIADVTNSEPGKRGRSTSWSTPTRAPRSRTPAARRRSSALAARP
jgi:ubiquinone/menaquinone biosynthesis C-methylase UbiE